MEILFSSGVNRTHVKVFWNVFPHISWTHLLIWNYLIDQCVYDNVLTLPYISGKLSFSVHYGMFSSILGLYKLYQERRAGGGCRNCEMSSKRLQCQKIALHYWKTLFMQYAIDVRKCSWGKAVFLNLRRFIILVNCWLLYLPWSAPPDWLCGPFNIRN